MKEIILDVGCGSSKIPGSIGIDQFPLQNVDIVHNLNSIPWPFENEKFDRIVFSHSISHLNDLPLVIEECHRLLKTDGFIEIVAPHYTSDNFNTDPTHRIHLGIRSMNYFANNIKFGYRYIPDNICLKLISTNISFREADTSWRETIKFNFLKLIGVEWLVNKFPRAYEHFFAGYFPHPRFISYCKRKLLPKTLPDKVFNNNFC